MVGTGLKFESWKVKNHIGNASKHHFYCSLREIGILKSSYRRKSPTPDPVTQDRMTLCPRTQESKKHYVSTKPKRKERSYCAELTKKKSVCTIQEKTLVLHYISAFQRVCRDSTSLMVQVRVCANWCLAAVLLERRPHFRSQHLPRAVDLLSAIMPCGKVGGRYQFIHFITL